jgi:hypothetical protein
MPSVLGRYPAGTWPRGVDFQPEAEPPIFAAGRDWGKGRLLVLADHSVFINDMMLQEDNDNIGFAYNCLDWLREGGGRRDRVLLLEEGVVNSNLDVPLSPPLLPPPGPWMNQLLRDIQAENLLNRAILGRVSPNQLFRGLFVVLTGGLLLFGLGRLLKARYHVEAGSSSLAGAVRRLAPQQSVLEQRQQDLLRRDNLWEPARILARECLEPLIGTAAVDPPQLVVQGGWRQRRRLKKQVHRLWRLAYEAAPTSVTTAEFQKVVEAIENVKAALSRGALQIKA